MRKDPPQLVQVDPHRIKFNAQNPRKHEGMEFVRLKQSVQEVGVVQFPTVRTRPGGFYECIDGEGRVKAAQEAELEKIWVICLGLVSDDDALIMLQAANEVREFSYLARCKGLANLHRQGHSGEQIAKSLGVNTRTVQMNIAVGYFPEQTLALIQNDMLQSSESRLANDSGEEDLRNNPGISWSEYTFYALLLLRIQIKSIPKSEKGMAPMPDGAYDYTEIHRFVEKIVHGEIKTRDQLHVEIERRRSELAEERFDKTLQIRLAEELDQAKQALDEAHEQDLQNAKEETAHRYAAQITQLQRQFDEMEARHQKIAKEVATHPQLAFVAKREAELEQKRQEVEKERIHLRDLQQQLQEEVQKQQKRQQQIEKDFNNKVEAMLQERLKRELKQANVDLEAYYAERDQKRQFKVEKTFRHAIAHGIELLAQAHEWVLLLLTPEMSTGVRWLQESELVSLVAQIRTVRNTLEKAEEVILHGGVADATPAEEGGSNVGDDSSRKKSKNLGYG